MLIGRHLAGRGSVTPREAAPGVVLVGQHEQFLVFIFNGEGLDVGDVPVASHPSGLPSEVSDCDFFPDLG
jgi:hypothetical protein